MFLITFILSIQYLYSSGDSDTKSKGIPRSEVGNLSKPNITCHQRGDKIDLSFLLRTVE